LCTRQLIIDPRTWQSRVNDQLAYAQDSWSLILGPGGLRSMISCLVHKTADHWPSDLEVSGQWSAVSYTRQPTGSQPIISVNCLALHVGVDRDMCLSPHAMQRKCCTILLSQRSVLAKRLTLVNDNSEWRRTGNRSWRCVGRHVHQTFGLLGKVSYFCEILLLITGVPKAYISNICCLLFTTWVVIV